MSARHIVHHRAPAGTAAHLHSRFHVLLVCINTQRFRSRYERLNDTVAHFRSQGVEPWIIEGAFGRRAFAVTDAEHPRHIQVRSHAEIWHKEGLYQIGLSRLPADWKYVMLCDGDVSFVRPDIVNETTQQLQHYDVVQCFSEAHDLGPDYQVLAKHEAFCWSHMQGRPKRCFGQGNYYYAHPKRPGWNIWHPGFAWGWRRRALDACGGLIDFAALGSGDNHMAWSLLGEYRRSIHPAASVGYRRAVRAWQQRAETHIRRNIGCVQGTLLHHWHGKKADRRYRSRWRILVENGFDPNVDLKRDTQGLWQLVDTGTPRSIKLRDGIRNYFAARREDSTDV